jgi:hypothetical protein
MIYQLDNGKWTHTKTKFEFDDRIAAAMDYRFCGEWQR